jgi:hypothetical protein
MYFIFFKWEKIFLYFLIDFTVCNTQKDIYLFIFCIFVRSHLAKKKKILKWKLPKKSKEYLSNISLNQINLNKNVSKPYRA